jgi:hypothetical protein
VNDVCQITYPSCPATSCNVSKDCVQPGPSFCTKCADGSTVCPTAVCPNGTCELQDTPCPMYNECKVASDCPQPACGAACCMAVCTVDHRCQTQLCMSSS